MTILSLIPASVHWHGTNQKVIAKFGIKESHRSKSLYFSQYDIILVYKISYFNFIYVADHAKYFQNGTFPKRIVDLVKEVPKSRGLDYECAIKLLYKLAPASTYSRVPEYGKFKCLRNAPNYQMRKNVWTKEY